MATISYSSLCASITSSAINARLDIGPDFKLTEEITKNLFKHLNNVNVLRALKKKHPNSYGEYIQFRNMIVVFGTDIQPGFVTNKGCVVSMYSPSIYRTPAEIKSEVNECEFMVKFGNKHLGIVYDDGIWRTTDNKLSFSFGEFKITGRSGEFNIVLATGAINGSQKSTDQITFRVGVKRNEKDKTKDIAPASIIKDAFEEGDLSVLRQYLNYPPSGNKFTYHFSHDRFEFGKYPVVSLSKERREFGKKSWINYIVSVIDHTGNTVNIRLDGKDQPMWNVLSTFYKWTDENGVVFNNDDEEDLLSFMGTENRKFVIVYNEKIKRQTNEGKVYYQASVHYEENESPTFIKLSESESKISNTPTLNLVEPTQPKEKIAGVDDLINGDDEFSLVDPIPFG